MGAAGWTTDEIEVCPTCALVKWVSGSDWPVEELAAPKAKAERSIDAKASLLTSG